MNTQLKEERGTNMQVHTHTHLYAHNSAAMITQVKEERGTNMQVHTHTHV
jgi:hypothetical protein